MKVRTRLILVILVSAFVTLTFFSALQINHLYHRDYQQFVEKTQYFDRLAEEYMQNALWNLDASAVDSGVTSFLSEPDIVGIKVNDGLGQISLAHYKPLLGNEIKHLVPVYRMDKAIGSLEISYRTNTLNRDLADAVAGLLLLELAVLLVLGAMVIVAAVTITRPLYQIIDRMHDYGKFGWIDWKDAVFQGELADLANTIDAMVRSLQERELTIQRVSAESAAREMKLNMEQELRRQSDVHRQELQNSLETLRQARQQLIVAEKMALLGSLVAGVAHEINTPIGVAVTAASFLSDKSRAFAASYRAGASGPAQVGAFLDTVADSIDLVLANLDRAATLIRSFKQVSVDQSSESLRSFEVGAYIREVVRSLQPRLREKEIELTVECPDGLVVRSYPGAYSQIFTNLVINSLVHGFKERERGKIAIRVEVSPDRSQLTCVYEDDGRGVSEYELAHLFEPFFTSMRNNGGSGLGTYIVYNLATQRLGGAIQASNRPEGGLRYAITVPADAGGPQE